MIDMVYCVSCGTKLAEEWNVCPQCGVKRAFSEDGQWYWNGNEWIPKPTKPPHGLSQGARQELPSNVMYTQSVKSKGLAYALNFLIPGLGNLYLGNSWAVGFMLIWFVVSTIVLVDLGAWLLFAIIFVYLSCATVSNDYVRYIRKIKK